MSSDKRIAEAVGLSKFEGAYLRRRYAILFYSLLFTMAAGPLSEALGFGSNLLELLLAASLLAAVNPIDNRHGRRFLLGVLVAALALRFGAAWLNHPAISSAGLAIWTIVALLAAIFALRFSLRARAVTNEHLYAALSAYVLAGIFCGVFYWILERAWPGSLGIAGEGVEVDFPLMSAIYFSFVTLATLGYGDIVPRSEAARGLAMVEAVVGQLYLAVMVARLVSLYVTKVGEGKQLD
ncbi:MAG: potassium channel family protein [bacterium]